MVVAGSRGRLHSPALTALRGDRAGRGRGARTSDSVVALLPWRGALYQLMKEVFKDPTLRRCAGLPRATRPPKGACETEATTAAPMDGGCRPPHRLSRLAEPAWPVEP